MNSPPQVPLRFFKWFCRADYHIDIEGDLLEMYDRRVKQLSKKQAGRRLWWDVLRLFRPSMMYNPFSNPRNQQLYMLKQNVSLAFRNFNRYRTYFTLNLLGFALGLGIAMALFWIVRFERSFDNFHADADRVFQIMSYNPRDYDSHVPSGIISTLNASFPEVEQAAIVHNVTPEVLKIGDRKYTVPKSFFMYPGILDMLDLEWRTGDPKTSLQRPDQVAISVSEAERLFPDQEPVGQVIDFNSGFDSFKATVSGIFLDPPANTSFPFKMIFSFEAHPWSWVKNDDYWDGGDSSHKGLIKLHDPSTAAQVASRLTQIATSHEDFSYDRLELVPIRDLHSHPADDPYNYYTPAWALDWLLYAGIFLLAISCINFINLSTAHAMVRTKNTSIRKMLGSSRRGLILQFLTETGLLVLLGIVAATFLTGLLLNYVNQFFATAIPALSVTSVPFLLFAGVLWLIVTLVSGLYPAWIVSRSEPISAAGAAPARRSKLTLRHLLIAFQFVIAQVMVVAILVGSKQVGYLRSKDLGFRTEDVAMIPIPERDPVKKQRFEQQLQALAGIEKVSFGLMSPSNDSRWSNDMTNPRFASPVKTRVNFIDPGYLDFYDLELLAGRNFTHADTAADVAIITQSMVAHMGFQDLDSALGQVIEGWGGRQRVVGVVGDFISENLKEETISNMFMIKSDRYWTAHVAVSSDNRKEVLEAANEYWSALYPNYLFDYELVEDHLQSYYESDRKFGNFLGLFAAISILIGCLGLYGLVYFVVLRRTKEIGIRKALGAEVSQIIQTLSIGFAKPVILSVLLAIPIVWYLMDIYLGNYAYGVEMNVLTYMIAAVLTLAGAALPVLLQSGKAARQNPVEALRDE